MRLSPETTGTFPSTYLRVRRRTVVGPSCSSRTSAMKPSSLRMRAISRLVRDAGTTTSVWRARDAFRTRVSMSAIGSEMFIGSLPTRLRDAGQLAQERTLPEADAAQREPSQEGARPSAHVAAVIRAHLELRSALRLCDHRLLGHVSPSPRLRGEGHAEEFKKLLGLLVGLRRRHDADLQPAETVHLVVIDLRERELLAQSQRVVAPPIEGLVGDPPEVADARQRHRRQPVQEVPHPLSAEGHLGPDRVARPHVELGDRTLRLGDDRLLAGDGGQVAQGRIERLGIGQGFAQADVDDDLADLRNLVRVAVFELLAERRDDLGVVALVQSAGHDLTSSCSPQWRQTRTRRPLSSVACEMRVGLPQLEQMTMALPNGIGWAISRMPPCWILGMRSVELDVWRALVCRLAMFRPSTTTLTPPAVVPRRNMLRPRGAGWRRMTRSTVPCLPASRPESTTTVSPLRISGTFGLREIAARTPITAPPGRGTRSSCSSDRAARARPGRRCACRAG